MPQSPEQFRRDVVRSLLPARAFDHRPLPRVPGGLQTMAYGATVFFAIATVLQLI